MKLWVLGLAFFALLLGSCQKNPSRACRSLMKEYTTFVDEYQEFCNSSKKSPESVSKNKDFLKQNLELVERCGSCSSNAQFRTGLDEQVKRFSKARLKKAKRF